MNNPTIPVACFAPPLTDELLANYETLVATLPAERAELKDAMQQCLACVKAWWELPASTRTDGETFDIRHRGEKRKYTVTPLESEQVQRLWDVTPWMRELVAIEPLFDALPLAEKELRDAACHLLWHAKEITLDREPLTSDKL